jgi:hypothetical protein
MVFPVKAKKTALTIGHALEYEVLERYVRQSSKSVSYSFESVSLKDTSCVASAVSKISASKSCCRDVHLAPDKANFFST